MGFFADILEDRDNRIRENHRKVRENKKEELITKILDGDCSNSDVLDLPQHNLTQEDKVRLWNADIYCKEILLDGCIPDEILEWIAINDTDYLQYIIMDLWGNQWRYDSILKKRRKG